ncbi:MAG: hypothetical protein LUD29_00790 [Clostridia bacterium]|nr:hypothetical protein [Clostridia bacterium]
MKYAVIDISSSGVSLIVAEVKPDNPTDAEIIFKDRIYLSLSYYLDNNNITDRGIEKLVDALKSAKRICKSVGVGKCYVISTASLRNATNCAEVESKVAKHTGLFINYIDAETEAYCDYMANNGFSVMEGPVLVDIGGKSIEICDFTKDQKEDMFCLDFGLFDIRNKYSDKRENPDKGEYEEIKKYIKQKFNDYNVPKVDTFKNVILVGATSRAVYDVYTEFVKTSSSMGPMTMDRKAFKKMVKFLVSDDSRSRLLLTAAPERVPVIIPACLVIRHVFKRFDVETVIVSDRGVKEGYLNLILQGKESGICCGFDADGNVTPSQYLPSSKKGKKKTKIETDIPDASPLSDTPDAPDKNGDE